MIGALLRMILRRLLAAAARPPPRAPVMARITYYSSPVSARTSRRSVRA